MVSGSEPGSGSAKRGRGKRGPAKCKNLKPEDMYIEVNQNNLPIGKKGRSFDSWLGLAARSTFPEYWISSKDFDKQKWKDFWLYVQKEWHLDDSLEEITVTRAKNMRTGYISKDLWRKFQRTGENPCLDKTFFNPKMWDTFVEMKNTEEAKDKSDKARKSAQNNKIPHRTGRSGYRGLEENMPEI
ncbi:hypothetical protein HanRHA438_Chr14g0682341 [Helianthus annuus]|nr:hypothetical protein HanRHA438_Chr14g0682341 [Helianthus annuus]